MRIAALGLHHETNTFSSFPTTYESFSASSYGGLLRADEIERHQRETHSTFAGYFQAADEFGFDLAPLLFAVNDPSGTITRDAFDRIVGEMMDLLRDGGPWDGVLLNQMGAAVSEEYPDVDGEIARRVRALVGPDVPVVMTLDLHANLSRQMAEHTDAIVVYRTNPHMDARERAIEACEILVRTMRREIRPASALEMPPMVISILRQDTREEPMRSVIADVEEANRRPGIIHTSTGQGYPWADVAEMGAAFYAVADGDEGAARAAARWMAERAWARRAELADAPTYTPREALEYASRAPRGPFLLLDVGDNVGAGSAGDSTFILAEAQRLGIGSLLETFRDAPAVQACVAAGVGARVSLTLGGRTDTLHGSPVNVIGRRAADRRRAVRGTSADSRRLSLLQQRDLGRAEHGRRAHAVAGVDALPEHQPPAILRGWCASGGLPDHRCKRCRFAAAGLSANRRRNAARKYAGRVVGRSVKLSLSPSASAALSVRT